MQKKKKEREREKKRENFVSKVEPVKRTLVFNLAVMK